MEDEQVFVSYSFYVSVCLKISSLSARKEKKEGMERLEGWVDFQLQHARIQRICWKNKEMWQQLYPALVEQRSWFNKSYSLSLQCDRELCVSPMGSWWEGLLAGMWVAFSLVASPLGGGGGDTDLQTHWDDWQDSSSSFAGRAHRRAGDSLVCRGLGGCTLSLLKFGICLTSEHEFSSCGGGASACCLRHHGSYSCQPHFFHRQMFQNDCVCLSFWQPAWCLRALELEGQLVLNPFFTDSSLGDCGWVSGIPWTPLNGLADIRCGTPSPVQEGVLADPGKWL